MDNYSIADQFDLLAKLMDIHGENEFKSKNYGIAAYNIEKLEQPLNSMSPDEIYALKGIGKSTGEKILNILETGALDVLQEYLNKTPAGVLEMMNIKGLGPKKIHQLWKQMGIASVEELVEACKNNLIASTKGFGAKTQQNILDAVQFQQEHIGKYLYARVADFAEAFTLKLREYFPEAQFELTGAYKRQMEIIDELEWVTTVEPHQLTAFLEEQSLTLSLASAEALVFNAEDMIILRFHLANMDDFYQKLFISSSSNEFLKAIDMPLAKSFSSEAEIFEAAGLPFIPPYRRENAAIIERFDPSQELVQVGDIKGLIHSHSRWSDGAHTLREMAETLIAKGFEYLVISDHSRAAYYANGLSIARIAEQQAEIAALNKELAPFKIFSSIECDILNDGSLDYPDEVLKGFDLVITSVHSNLSMGEEKAMTRLMGAINNPYTTILGHMTGRILLKRKGYPVDHKTIIDACAERGVCIEINANPKRLDMDWRWIEYALDKGLMLSINPDAHTLDEFDYVKYGVLVAQKGGLTAKRNLSSYSLKDFEQYLKQHRPK